MQALERIKPSESDRHEFRRENRLHSGTRRPNGDILTSSIRGPSGAGCQARHRWVFDLFNQKPVLVLCDYHGLAQQEDFYSELVRDPRFADVGNVVVEFGEASQNIIDRYVTGDDVPLTELRRVWTETAGLAPGPFWLGYVNFLANVRATNLKLSPEHRIKVWLGDPKIDCSKTNSYQDLVPYLLRRDDNFVRIIRAEILQKHKKTLLIIGSPHILVPDCSLRCSKKTSPTHW